ncbi:hypothetical protein CLOSTMETH_00478 [[Clostridium] methylpentosum DSM 5476]|uniref:Uncharacterized protein n=1 Tax=[Clostridium] methylpentosum DSM 5476 TaxID=537013 RepID=C0E9H9_9FIRM|nr:hypothetical protein CLOSTMETH_00478 [[Clostridium] methylpentosum DSM 5476]
MRGSAHLITACFDSFKGFPSRKNSAALSLRSVFCEGKSSAGLFFCVFPLNFRHKTSCLFSSICYNRLKGELR